MLGFEAALPPLSLNLDQTHGGGLGTAVKGRSLKFRYPPRKNLRWALICSLATALAACGGRQPELLQPDQRVEGRLRAGQASLFAVDLKAGDALSFELEEGSCELQTALLSPEGKTLFVADAPPVSLDIEGDPGSKELLVFVAETPGRYQLEVSSSITKVRCPAYRARLLAKGPSTTEDQHRAAALRHYTRGRRLAQSDARGALPRFRKAVRRWRQGRAPLQAALAQEDLAQIQWSLGEKAPALDNLRQAVELYARHSPGRYFEAAKLLTPWLRNQGGGAAALELGQESLAKANELHLLREQANAHADLFFAHRLLGQVAEANQQGELALSLWRQLKDRRQAALALHQLGRLSLSQGDLQQATLRLQEAISLYPNEDWGFQREAASWIALGKAHLNAGKIETSLEATREALSLLLTLRKTPANLAMRAEARLAEGRALTLAGDRAAALNAVQRGLETLEGPDTENPRLLRAARRDKGWLLLESGKPEEALAILRMALTVDVNHHQLPRSAPIYLALARAHLLLDSPQTAWEHIDQALTRLEEGPRIAYASGSFFATGPDPYFDLAKEIARQLGQNSERLTRGLAQRRATLNTLSSHSGAEAQPSSSGNVAG